VHTCARSTPLHAMAYQRHFLAPLLAVLNFAGHVWENAQPQHISARCSRCWFVLLCILPAYGTHPANGIMPSYCPVMSVAAGSGRHSVECLVAGNHSLADS
jgi:hypothetical protein